MSDLQTTQDNLIFCDMSVFSDDKRQQHMEVAQALFAKVTELRETSAGYALRLPDEEGIILKMAEFINDDRRCCQFIHFGIDIEAYGKGIWLTLKGTADAKTAIKAELLGLIPNTIMED